MVDTILKSWASKLSKEISERELYNLQEIETLITVRVNDFIWELLRIYTTKAEKEYEQGLKELRDVYQHHKRKYVSKGLDLALIKQRLKRSNRAMNELHKHKKYQELKTFIRDRYGQGALNEFYNHLDTVDYED